MNEITNTATRVEEPQGQLPLPVIVKTSAFYLILIPMLYISFVALVNLNAASWAGPAKGLGIALTAIFLFYSVPLALFQILPTLFLLARKKLAWFILMIFLPLKIIGYAWLVLTDRYETTDIGFPFVIVDFFATVVILLILVRYKHVLGFIKND